MAVADPYGIDIALTDDGDVVVTPAGQVGLIGGPANCIQAVTGRVRTIVGELPLHPEYGSAFPTHKFIGRKLLDTLPIETEARRELNILLAEDPRFIAANGVQAIQDPNQPQTVQVKAALVLVGGQVVRIADLAAPRVDEISDPTINDVGDTTLDPSVIDTSDVFNDFEFIAQDDNELTDLADAADLTNIVAQGS